MQNTRSAATQRLLKCFCGCSGLTVEDVQRIYRLNAHGLVTDDQATKLFQSFLTKEKQYGDDSLAQQFLNIHRYVQRLRANKEQQITQDDIDELVDLGLPWDKERKLTEALENESPDEIESSLKEIQTQCSNEIGLSAEYKRFQAAILKKLQNRS